MARGGGPRGGRAVPEGVHVDYPLLRGPRRVGKTVLLRQLIESLIAEAVNPQRILYIAFDELPTLRDLDEPVLTIARWYESHAVAVGTARPV